MSNERAPNPVSPLFRDLADVNDGAVTQRRLTPLFPVDLGEQAVGSSHTFPVHSPVNVSDRAGSATVKAQGDEAFSVPWIPTLIVPKNPVAPIELRFHPSRPGEHRTTIAVHAQWNDGHVEDGTVQVSARARNLDDVPEQTSSLTAATQSPTTGIAGLPRPDESVTEGQMAVSDELQNAAIKVDHTFISRANAVDAIAGAQRGFSLAHEAPSLWTDLAELALNLATAGVGKFVEDAVATRVAGAIEHSAETAAGTVLKNVAKEAGKEPIQAAVLGTMVADGMSHVVEQGPEMLDHTKGAEAEENANGESSVPSESDFFEFQKEKLNDANEAASTALVGVAPVLRGMAKNDPSTGLAAAKAITAAIASAEKTANDIQHSATASQFAAYKARVSLGTESVRAGTSVSVATDLEGTRQYRDGGTKAPRGGDGLLDIEVELDGDSVKVTSASVTGIAQQVANYLLHADLAASHMPLRIRTNGHGFITCDELGRIRTNDYMLPLESNGEISDHEAQRMRGAERVARVVMSRSLAAWGLHAVVTNDAGASKQKAEE